MDGKELIRETLGTIVLGSFLLFVLCFIQLCFYSLVELVKDIKHQRKNRNANKEKDV